MERRRSNRLEGANNGDIQTRNHNGQLSLSVTTLNNIACENSRNTEEANFLKNIAIQSVDYNLNKLKAINKKLQAIDRGTPFSIKYTTQGGKNLVIQCQTGLYELMRKAICSYFVHLNNHSLDADIKCLKEKSSGLIVQTTYQMAKRGGGQNMYSINMYHTKSAILVNGRATDSFMEEDWPKLMTLIHQCSEINPALLNQQLKLQLQGMAEGIRKGKALQSESTQAGITERLAADTAVDTIKQNNSKGGGSMSGDVHQEVNGLGEGIKCLAITDGSEETNNRSYPEGAAAEGPRDVGRQHMPNDPQGSIRNSSNQGGSRSRSIGTPDAAQNAIVQSTAVTGARERLPNINSPKQLHQRLSEMGVQNPGITLNPVPPVGDPLLATIDKAAAEKEWKLIESERNRLALMDQELRANERKMNF